MNKIKILHTVWHMGAGGLEHVAMEICRRVNRRKYDVSIVCFEACYPEYRQKLSTYGIPVYLIKKTKKIDLLFYRRFISLLNDQKIDIVHIHSCLFESSICGIFSRVKGVLFTAHGMPVETDFISSLQNFIGLRLVNHIVTVSDEIGNYFHKRLKIPRKKIEVMYNGVDVSEFKSSKNNHNVKMLKRQLKIPFKTIVIGSVGRLEAVKNHAMLIQAFKKLINLFGSSLHLVLIGDGSRRNELEGLCKKLDIADSVSFLGIRDNISELLNIVDIFVLTSFTEGVSISLLEAQAKGIPAVVSDVGGNNRVVIHDINGYLFKLNDEDAFCAQIIKLIENKDLYKRLSENSRNRVLSEFNLDIIINKYESIYNSLCN